MHTSTCVFTIASKNYLSQVRTLLASVRQHHPEVQTYLVLCDRVDGYFRPEQESFRTILAEHLGIERFADVAFKYNCLELNTAVKPFAIDKFFQEYGFDRVIYLDPDIVVYRRLEELFELLEHHDVVLTPHITDFLPDDGCLPDNIRILQTGTNNLGFVAMRHTERVATLVHWWGQQLYDHCRHAIAEGEFVDQKWMDLVLACVESAVLLRHPGYNVAYWNLAQRRISRDADGEYLVNGEPLAFFHFSGFDPNCPAMISKHQTRLSWSDLGGAGRALFQDYCHRLFAHGYRETIGWPYAYGAFGNGLPIPDCFRSFFRRRLAGQIGPETEVFGVDEDQATVYGLLQSPLHHRLLTAAAMALYESQADLQKAFPQVPGNDALNYANWFVYPGGGDARLDDVFVEPVRKLLGVSSARPKRGLTLRSLGHLRRMAARMAARIIRFAGRRRDLLNLLSPRLRYRAGRFLRRIAYPEPANRSSLPESRPGADPMDLQAGVNLFGLLDRPTGVGEAARGMAACFESLQIPVRKISFDERHLFFGQPLRSTSQPNPRFAINYCHVNADGAAALRHLFGEETFRGRLNIGFWAWELEDFPAAWDAALELYHEIWVPSSFVQQAVAARARVPVIRVPHCIDIPPLPHCGRANFGIPPDRSAILCMFDTGSYSQRKNPLAAIRAVKRACASGQDPVLVIKVGRPELEDGLLDKLRKEVQHIDCLMIERWLGREETWGLIAACDLLVALHRSEGFGLILAEAMALGRAVVATGYSGNMDFMNAANSFLVGYELTTLDHEVGPYPAGARWAEPDIHHAAQLIRSVLENPEHARRVGRRAAADVARNLSVEAISRQISQRLSRLGFTFAAPHAPGAQNVVACLSAGADSQVELAAKEAA